MLEKKIVHYSVQNSQATRQKLQHVVILILKSSMVIFSAVDNRGKMLPVAFVKKESEFTERCARNESSGSFSYLDERTDTQPLMMVEIP